MPMEEAVAVIGAVVVALILAKIVAAGWLWWQLQQWQQQSWQWRKSRTSILGAIKRFCVLFCTLLHLYAIFCASVRIYALLIALLGIYVFLCTFMIFEGIYVHLGVFFCFSLLFGTFSFTGMNAQQSV